MSKRRLLLNDNQIESSGVPQTRKIDSGTGLTGGGDLTADRTLSLTGQALALHELASNGFITRTELGVFQSRKLVSGSGISITNDDGVTGDPIITAQISSERQTRSGYLNDVISIIPQNGSFSAISCSATIQITRIGRLILLYFTVFTTQVSLGTASGQIRLSINDPSIKNILSNAGSGYSNRVLLAQLEYSSASAPWINYPTKIYYGNSYGSPPPNIFDLYRNTGNQQDQSTNTAILASDLTIHSTGNRNGLVVNMVLELS